MLFPIKKITLVSLSIALLFILSYIEKTFALNFLVPGVRFGFSNIVIIVFLYLYGFPNALIMTMLKILISTFVFGSVSGFLFTAFGSITSLLAMYFAIVIFKDKISQVGVSVLGGFFHILSQYISSYIILNSFVVWKLYPIAVLLSLITSIITGFVAKSILQIVSNEALKKI
jgi:heptaprenyl diphosphate synthase